MAHRLAHGLSDVVVAAHGLGLVVMHRIGSGLLLATEEKEYTYCDDGQNCDAADNTAYYGSNGS